MGNTTWIWREERNITTGVASVYLRSGPFEVPTQAPHRAIWSSHSWRNCRKPSVFPPGVYDENIRRDALKSSSVEVVGICSEWWQQRKGGQALSICGLGLLFWTNGYRYGIARGITNFVSCMYTTIWRQLHVWTFCTILCRFFGGLSIQCFVHFPNTRELSLHK